MPYNCQHFKHNEQQEHQKKKLSDKNKKRYASLLLLLLLSSADLCRFLFFKSGTLILAFFCITILGTQEYHTTFYHTTQHTVPSLWVRSGFASKIGDKENPKRDGIDLSNTYQISRMNLFFQNCINSENLALRLLAQTWLWLGLKNGFSDAFFTPYSDRRECCFKQHVNGGAFTSPLRYRNRPLDASFTFALGSLWVRSASTPKVETKREQTPPKHHPFPC